MSKIVLAIHGGAGVISKNIESVRQQAYLDGLQEALQQGFSILKKDGSALDAVETAVRSMEDNPLFNAGKGAVYTATGKHELDASIMCGKTLRCGAIAGVTQLQNPITVARKVMEHSPHILLVGTGAEEFARKHQAKFVTNSYFDTTYRFQQWQTAQQNERIQLDHSEEEPTIQDQGTVGAVAIDYEGNLAAATSTGGMTNKQFGRVGDSPIIGAGTFADNRFCAVSCTGHGEAFMRQVTAFDLKALMEYRNLSLTEAAHIIITQKLPAEAGGFIAIDREGNAVLPFNSKGMFRGLADNQGHFEIKIWE